MRKWILALAALALPTVVLAQTPDVKRADFAIRYDVDSATKTYCVLNGANGSPFGSPTRVAIPVETSGSSTTITAVTASTDPFAGDLGVGDVVLFSVSGATLARTVVTNADDDTITVDQAIDLSAGAGYTFSYMDLACGTAATSGWVNVRGFPEVQMTVSYLQGDLDTLDVAFECRDDSPDHNVVQVYPGPGSSCGFGALSTNVCQFATPATLPAASISTYFVGTFQDCRVALKYGSTDTSDAGANLERVNASITMYRR